MHVEELMDQADAYAARDYAQAYRIERAAKDYPMAQQMELGHVEVAQPSRVAGRPARTGGPAPGRRPTGRPGR